MRNILYLVFLACGGAAAAADSAAVAKELFPAMDAQAGHYGQLSRTIWENPEVGFQERKSSALLKNELRGAGFRVEDNAAKLPTAFVATWGAGKPVIGIMGEYDALPGMSQQDVAVKQARTEGGPGHACGHNNLGTASLFAAVAVKDYLIAHKQAGTVRFYGTPAEEGGGGKIYLLRAGAFRGTDVVLTWHPGSINGAGPRGALAIIGGKFRFRGRAAHAAQAPEMGRSALDAVMLFTHAVELMREHVPDVSRIHYIIDNGGAAANIVPDYASVTLYARHPDATVLDGIWQRIVKCAQAGALATETQVETEVNHNYNNIVPNDTLARLFLENLRITGGVTYSAQETKFAEELQKTLPQPLPRLETAAQVQALPDGFESYSTDVGDVSWNVPTAQFTAATLVPGVPLHSWQSTASNGSSIGRKGMMVAAKALALTAIELLQNPGLVAQAKSDFDRRISGRTYRSLLPVGNAPPSH
ncbi:MAG: amidohydrolase [Acidobacteria bacterium]|nr:amidohydrolase [Acidobacteriota bacterium]